MSALVPLLVHRFGEAAPRWPPRPLPVVVLGALVRRDGAPTEALRARVQVGVSLWQRALATRLVFSGGSPDGRPSEAEVMQRLALELGAPPDRLELEAASRTTQENARCCARLLPEREVLLVTCDFHLARASAHFREVGFAVWPVPSRRALSRAQRFRLTLKESAGLLAHPHLLRHLRDEGA